MSKSTPLPVRFPNEIYDRIDGDAKALRRSKASIILEIVEKHYENGKPTVTTTTVKKKAGSR
jgi:predicted DNA-binding protein